MVAAFRLLACAVALLSLIGSGVGIGLVFHALITSVARVPDDQLRLMPIAILGFALCEATGLFGLMVGFIILFG